MTTILITGIGGDIGQCIATIIRESLGAACRLIGCDTHEQHGGKLFVDAFGRLPGARDPGYLEALLSVIDSESVDTVIPMTEPELGTLLPAFLKHPRINWITPGAGVIEAGVDKLKTAQALTRLGITMPWTHAVSGGPPREYPCIVKSRYGSGSRAVHKAHDRTEAEYFGQRIPDAIYQEYLEPDDREVTCAVYRTRDGRVAVLQLLRRLSGGFTGWAQVIRDAAVEDLCRRAAEGLELRGSMNVQLRLTATGPRVFEINPRFSSTALMRHRIGYSDVLWSLDEAEGRPVEFSAVPAGTIVVRTQGAAVIHR
jgi:carbamoyl-phosphate synthase large subunit